MGHDHAEPHAHDGHGHEHGSPADYGRAFLLGLVLNAAFVVVEGTYGLASGSVALVADAAHNLTDVLGLAFAWAAFALARRRPTRQRTYGLRKTTVLAALANALLLLVAVGGVGWEAALRLRAPVAVPGKTMMVVAAIGVAVNGASALLFAKDRKKDANLRGAFLHLAGDAVVSLGVVVAGALITLTGWMWIDPVVSLAVAAVILVGTWGLLKQSLDLALDAVPHGIDADAVAEFLATRPGVVEVHDLHIWPMSTTETALTAHLVMESETCEPRFLRTVGEALRKTFGIAHPTLQVEASRVVTACAGIGCTGGSPPRLFESESRSAKEGT